jgi:hypothetical protein
MPEIDTDLFQVLVLALLFLSLLCLLAALSVLSGIKKKLDTRSAEPAAAQPSYEYQAPASTSYEPVAYTPAPVTTTPAATAAPAPQEVSTGFVSMTEATPAATPAASGLRGDEPEEQPFERDGRWWFKRGGELLVYDEGTGQWVAAPGGGSAAASPVAGTATEIAPRADSGEGWKCSSCGAVNGSTATSCRMCFTPR